LKTEHLRILLADDDRHVRAAVRAFLSTTLPCDIVGEAADGREAVAQVARHRPDAVLLDLRMPALDGIQATRLIKARWPDTAIVVLSLYPGRREEALAAGADAFVSKGDPPTHLIAALRSHVDPASRPSGEPDGPLPAG
jgi:DNA-binding NarL/FixJ family response regulator